MTDRFNALTVVLDGNIREDDAEELINAIRMIKGVADVQPHIADPAQYIAEYRARTALWEAMMEHVWSVAHGK